jgi:hypothetical protein
MSLSILIPSYEYTDGINLILESLRPKDKLDLNFEIIISDDSESDYIYYCYLSHREFYKEKLTYIKNIPSLGAIKNWNFLISKASKDFILLLHHDEFPLSENFLEMAISFLNREEVIDVILMDLVIMPYKLPYQKRHLPLKIRNFLLFTYDKFIFMHNFIGPVSSLIIRRSIFPKFDQNLRWNVDTDFYYRLKIITDRWTTHKSLIIGNLARNKKSITLTISPDLKNIKYQESKYLETKYSNIIPKRYFNDYYYFFKFINNIFWFFLLFLTLFINVYSNLKKILISLIKLFLKEKYKS